MIRRLLLIVLTLASPAWADQTPSQSVDYSDLDLSNEAGQATLRRRIQSAAEQSCHSALDSSRRLGVRGEEERCIEAAVTDAYASLPTHFAAQN